MRFASNTADVDIATHPGCYVDGDAGDDADNFEYDLNNDFAAKWVHRAFVADPWGQPGKSGRCQWIFDDNLIVLLQVSALPGS